MHTNLKALAAVVLVSALTAAQAQTTAGDTASGSSAPAKSAHKAHRKPKAPPKPTVEDQIESLRQDMQTQIQSLKQQLSDRDAQLQQAQQAAASAQAAAAQAQQAASAQQAAVSETNQQVSSLNGAVADLKTNNASLVQTIQHDQKNTRKAIENPDSLHFKGITLSPTGSYLAAETVWRQRATGGDISTAFSSIPLQNADAAKLSEFFGSGRQSRAALLAEGKLSNMTMRGYYEADWLGTGISSNNNQSNSYVLRQRQLWAQAELNSGWAFTGGQMWSLATETKQGLTNRSEATPQTIDPNYTTGFVWARQYGFRVVKSFDNKYWVGVAAENPQTLTLGGTIPAEIGVVLGSSGNSGGVYNGGGAPGGGCTVSSLPTTCTGSGNVASYSFNLAPDMIAKIAAEPGWGHWELFGVARFFRDRIYPNSTTSTVTDPNTGKTTTVYSISGAGAYNDRTVGGGIGGGFRAPLFAKKLDVGLKGLWGDGISRYGDTTLSDATVRQNGELALLHGFSALGTLELHATPRMDIYANYGGDYVGRNYFTDTITGKAAGYGNPAFSDSGCGKEPGPGTTPTNGFSPSTPGSCSANNRDVQEGTLGYWYTFYKGPMGQLRQGLQYSYIERQTWSGTVSAGGLQPKAIDNIFETSFRYYLP